MLLSLTLPLLLLLLLLLATAGTGGTADCRKYIEYYLAPVCKPTATADVGGSDRSSSSSSSRWLQCSLLAAKQLEASVASERGGSCSVAPAACGNYAVSQAPVLLPAALRQQAFLLFALRSRGGVGAWQLLGSSSESLQLPPEAGAEQVQFRSGWLDRLPQLAGSLLHKELLLKVYAGGELRLRIVFDIGSDSAALTRQNWFAQARVKASWPVSDLRDRACNFFSAEGHTIASHERRFFINFAYSGCASDTGLLLIVDSSHEVCDWAKRGAELPRILVNPDPSKTWATGVVDAQLFTVSVR